MQTIDAFHSYFFEDGQITLKFNGEMEGEKARQPLTLSMSIEDALAAALHIARVCEDDGELEERIKRAF